MPELIPIHLPQVGANDVTATLTEWLKPAGQWVHQGELIALAETTKSVFEIEAPAAGHLLPLVQVGQEAAVGQLIAALSVTALPPQEAEAQLAVLQQTPAVEGAPPLRSEAKPWTLKAELLARRHNIDLALVPAAGARITEGDVERYLAALQPVAPGTVAVDLVHDRYPANRVQRLLIVGGGNGAVQIIDALQRIPEQQAVAILDDSPALQGKRVAGVPILGPIDVDRAAVLLASGEFDAAVISISTSIPARARIFERWKARGIPFANVIHPSSVVGMNVRWGEGNVVMALCHFGACAMVGDNNFLSAFCSIEHHCVLGSHCSFGPGVVTSSRVQIGDRVRFGTGIFIEPGVSVGADSIIASGLAIAQNVPVNSLLKARLGYTVRAR